MKIFGFANKVFFGGLAILSDLTNASSWVVFQWVIKFVKQGHKLLILTAIILYFTLLVLKQVNIVAINDPMQLTINKYY